MQPTNFHYQESGWLRNDLAVETHLYYIIRDSFLSSGLLWSILTHLDFLCIRQCNQQFVSSGGGRLSLRLGSEENMAIILLPRKEYGLFFYFDLRSSHSSL